MDEVVAKKANFMPVYVIFFILSAALIGFGIFMGQMYLRVLYIVLGIFCLGVAVFALIKYARLPKYYIILREGKLYFHDGNSCTPDKIDNITVIYRRGRYSFPKFSSIELTANGKRYKFDYVYKAEWVKDCLQELKSRYANSNG